MWFYGFNVETQKYRLPLAKTCQNLQLTPQIRLNVKMHVNSIFIFDVMHYEFLLQEQTVNW